MASLEICSFLSNHPPYDSQNITALSRKIRLSPSEISEVIAYAFFRAFPLCNYLKITENLSQDVQKTYQKEVQLSLAILQSLAGKAHVDNHDFYRDVKSHPKVEASLNALSYTSNEKVSGWVEERTYRALCSLAAPKHQGQLLNFSSKTLELCKDLEAEHAVLMHKFYNNEECSPVELLSIYNIAAIFVSTDSPDKWMSLGEIIQMYYASVPTRREEVSLQSYPLSHITSLLNLQNPLPDPGELPDQSFQEFVVHITLVSIQQTFGFQLPELILQKMSESFMRDETLRKDLSFFVVYLENFVDEPILETASEEYPDRFHLFLSFRILFNLMTTHIPPEHRNQESMTEIALWVFRSNRKHIISLDKPYFPRPQSAEEVRVSFQPNEVAHRINALQPLYGKNGEEFLPNALNLLITFPKKSFIEFILKCNELPFAQVTTKQVLDFSHYKGERSYVVIERVLYGVVHTLPPGLEGMAPTFFDMITDPIANESEWPYQIELFNKLLSPRENEKLNSNLYFKVLHPFLKGKRLPEHFEMFVLFNEKMTANQRLDLIYRATHQHEEPPLETDPPHLHRALFLLKPQKLECIRAAMSLHKAEGPKLAQYLACQPLSMLPEEIDKEHLTLVQGYLVELNSHHTFTDEQQLHLFYEFLCLQEKRLILYQNIQLIHLIEQFIGHSLDTDAVYTYLCYHPDISNKDLQTIFDNLMQTRTQLMTSEINRPIVNPELMTRIVENLAELQYAMMDNERMIEFAAAYEHVNAMIGNLQFHLSAAIAFPFITHLLRGFPDSIPVQERVLGVYANSPMHFGPQPSMHFGPCSPCQALIPVSWELNIHKEMYSSWEEYEERYLYRFSLVSNTETFSGSALLPFNREFLMQQPMLLSVVKDLCTFLCLDTYWDCHNQEDLDYETQKDQINDLESLLAFNLKAKRVWKAFENPRKEAFAPGIFAFVVALKTQHRLALLNSATHGEKHHHSPMRLEPQTFSKLASQGNLFSIENAHSLLSAKLLPPSSALFYFYSSLSELQEIETSLWGKVCSQRRLHKLKSTSLLITENNCHVMSLPLLIHSRPKRVEYHYKVQVFEQAEVVNLVEELDDFEFDGTEITLQTEYRGQTIQVVVTYPNTKIPTQEVFTHWISWQIAMLKSRVYEKITHQASL